MKTFDEIRKKSIQQKVHRAESLSATNNFQKEMNQVMVEEAEVNLP